MDAARRFTGGSLLLAVLALGHALATWPLRSTFVLFVGGAVLAFVAEVVGIRLGLLRHHVRPQLAGVPAVVVIAWPATVYVCFRLATLVLPPGVGAAALAAAVATGFDVTQDPIGVERGLWAYPATQVSNPRYRGVPWWNFAAWFSIVFGTSMLAVLAG